MSVNKFGEKKYFIEDCDVKDLPSDPIIRDAFIRIWDKFKSSIFIWESFKTDLPFSTDEDITLDREVISVDRHQQDLRAMCFYDNGKRKRLNKEQLAQIAKNGRFTVKSQIDERFDNIWLLGSVLQIGRDEISARLMRRKEKALRHWFLYLPEYFSTTSQLSFIGGLKTFKDAASHLFRILLGMPEYRPRYAYSKISLLLDKARISHLIEAAKPDSVSVNHWSIANQQSLNLILVNPDALEIIKEVIQQQIDDLTSHGDTTDKSLLKAVIEHPDIIELDADLPELLKGFHHFYYQLSPLNPAYNQYYDAEIQRLDQQLIEAYPYRGRYKSWRDYFLKKKVDEVHQRVRRQLADDLLTDLDEGQEAYVLKQNIEYEKQFAEGKKNQLSVKMRLYKVFKFPVIHWSLKLLETNERLPVRRIKLATRQYGWRLFYVFILARIMLSNNCLRLLRAWKFNPYGIKSVFTLSKEKFRGEIFIKNNGRPFKAKKYATYLTDLYEIRQSIKRLREQFESRSDYGLFPRSVGRFFNRFYCYFIIGAVGSLINITYRVLAFSLLSLIVISGVLLAPLWVPILSILVFLFNVLIYDFIGPKPYYKGRMIKPYFSAVPLVSTIVYFMLFRGVLVSTISLFGVVLHIVAVPVLYLLAIIAFVLRHLWDALMRIVFIYPLARVPGDNFNGVITRIAGYGIAANILTTVTKDDGLQKYKLWLQIFILDIYESVAMKHLNSSETILNEMMVGPYQAILGDMIYPVEESIRDSINGYERDIHTNLYRFRDSVHSKQSSYRAELIRLPRSELAAFASDTEDLCQLSIERDLMSWLSAAEKKLFWLNLGVNENDWSLLNRVLLCESFSGDIFTPIEDCDETISVEAEHVNIAKSLLIEKQPVSILNFTVSQQALSPQTDKQLLFSDNTFWDELYESLYLPLRWSSDWRYLLRLRSRRLD